ncbi:hypothetical protein DVH24_006224 [Malus domestica]|uniref:Uncharacterized protein n=1 Tax=Malus domestica TaxID=3750 RepID=A0A498KC78_MALDO|nr:hypothetical protein DVH24_006224 [Malus domestica]
MGRTHTPREDNAFSNPTFLVHLADPPRERYRRSRIHRIPHLAAVSFFSLIVGPVRSARTTMSEAPLKFESPIRDAISRVRFALKSDNVLIFSHFEILGEFFNDLHTSIRLLRLRGLKSSFSNIYSQIECFNG